MPSEHNAADRSSRGLLGDWPSASRRPPDHSALVPAAVARTARCLEPWFSGEPRHVAGCDWLSPSDNGSATTAVHEDPFQLLGTEHTAPCLPTRPVPELQPHPSCLGPLSPHPGSARARHASLDARAVLRWRLLVRRLLAPGCPGQPTRWPKPPCLGAPRCNSRPKGLVVSGISTAPFAAPVVCSLSEDQHHNALTGKRAPDSAGASSQHANYPRLSPPSAGCLRCRRRSKEAAANSHHGSAWRTTSGSKCSPLPWPRWPQACLGPR